MSAPDQTLQALLANLRPRSQASTTAAGTNVDNLNSNAPHPPPDMSMSFSSASAVPNTPPPPFSPTLPTVNTGSQNATAQNLLNLLNFGGSNQQRSGSQPAQSTTFTPSPTQPTKPAQESSFTTADFLRRAASTSSRGVSAVNPATSGFTIESQAQNSIQDSASTPLAMNSPAASTSTFAHNKSQTGQHQALAPTAEPAKPMFTYKNPFEALRASRPHTPQKERLPVVDASQQDTLQAVREQHPQEEVPVQSIEDPSLQEVLNSAMPDRVKLTPKTRSSRQATPNQQVPVPEQMSTSAAAVAPQEQLGQMSPGPVAAHSQDAVVAPEETDNLPSQMHDSGGGDNSAVDVNGTSQRIVPILTFPVKAFVSLTLQLKVPATTQIRQDGVMEISRLKKDFDQTDRSLAAASSKYIVYALVKNGGIRIIRQEDGSDKQLFKHTHDRIFNVSVCTSSSLALPNDHQAVLGTGVSGTVYYATLMKKGHDLFTADELERDTLVFPPYPQADENTAGGVLKTRAKRSSQHPQYFAIGRGKAINIIWPSALINNSAYVEAAGDQNRVNTEKLFHERPLQILTGKAGKDFTFSEDDTAIVSLDKTGRLRFWDIRKLTDEENARSVQITPYIVDTPILSLSTASPSEKSWPTSVHFIDKARPYVKGGALRYVLVGLRQNHTLQLWDIALGKAVQELNFPHTSETDGICSVAYHPPSGIVVVGHPTRNSIFFIHLSAPRYVLSSSLSQASFIQRVAAKDAEIPKPESTACMSGIREISFAGRGQLRSVELLPVHKEPDSVQGDAHETLFELYVAHSTGVTCLVINKEDMGWDADNKAVQSVNAEQEGLVTLKDLKLGSVIENDTRSKSPAQEVAPAKQDKKKKAKKQKDTSSDLANGVQDSQSEAPRALESGLSESNNKEVPVAEQNLPKDPKKTKKKKDPAAENNAVQMAETVKAQSGTFAPVQEAGPTSRRNASPTAQPSTEALSMSISGDWLDKEMKKLEKTVKMEFKKELDQLYQNIKTDRASQDQASASRQEAVLRVVSATLNTNVEKTLSSILRQQMQDVVVPSVIETISAEMIPQIIQGVNQSVKKELGSELPIQLNTTLQSPQMLRSIATDIASKVSLAVEQEVKKSVSTTMVPSMSTIATNTATELVAASEARMVDQVSHMSRQHGAFNEKIEELNRALQSVTSTLETMMEAQHKFQAQLMRDLQQSRSTDNFQPPPRQPAAPTFSPAPSMKATPAQRPNAQADPEIEQIRALMEQRKYEDGSIKWLQSSQPVKLFDELFVRFTPDYLATDVTPLVAFSIGVTVANNLSTNTQRRLEWIRAAFDTVDFKDREILELKDHAPTLIGNLIQKLEVLYRQRVQANSNDPVVAMIPPILATSRHMIATFEAVGSGHLDGRQGRIID